MTSQIVSALLGLLLAGAILYLVRRDHLHGSYAVWWLTIAAATLVLGAFPSVIDSIGHLVGIYYPPVLAITIGIAMILIRMLRMDVDRSKQERQIRRLAQKLAILEHELSARSVSVHPAIDKITRGKSAQVIPMTKSGDT